MSRLRTLRRFVPAVMATLVLAGLLGYPGLLLYTWRYGETAVAHVASCPVTGDRCHGTWRFADGRSDAGRVRLGRPYEGRDVAVVVGPLGAYVRDDMWSKLWPYAAGPFAAAAGLGIVAVMIPLILRRSRRMEREMLTGPLPAGGIAVRVTRAAATRPDGSRYATRSGSRHAAEIRDAGGALRYRLARLPAGRVVQVSGPAGEPIGSVHYDTTAHLPRFEFRDAGGAPLAWARLPSGVVTVYPVTDRSGATVATWLVAGLRHSVLRVDPPVPEPLPALLLVLAFEGGSLMR